MQHESLKLARYLRETYGQNNNIILVSPNSIFFLVAYMAIMKSGNVCVPLNPSIEDHNLSFVVELCNSNIAFIAPSLKDSKWEIMKHLYYEFPELRKW